MNTKRLFCLPLIANAVVSNPRVPLGVVSRNLISLALTLVTGAVCAAGLVFSDGFEDGTTNKWLPGGSRDHCIPVTTSVDNVNPHSGKFMAECNWNGTVPWNDPAAFSGLVLQSWPYTSEFLIRLWVRLANDVDHVNQAKILRLFPNSGKTDQLYMEAAMAEPIPYLFLNWTLDGTQMPSHWGDGTPIGDGNWHKIEIYVKQNSPGATDGIVRVWKDGRLQQQFTNVATITPTDRWGALFVMSNWSAGTRDASNHVYWDDFEIYSDAASGATGEMNDASAFVAATAPKASLARPDAPSTVIIK